MRCEVCGFSGSVGADGFCGQCHHHNAPAKAVNMASTGPRFWRLLSVSSSLAAILLAVIALAWNIVDRDWLRVAFFGMLIVANAPIVWFGLTKGGRGGKR